MIIAVAQSIISTAAEEDAGSILSNLADDGRLTHEHALTGLTHTRTEGMERDEAQRKRFDGILHLEQFLFAEVVDAELGCSQMHQLAVVELDPQLLSRIPASSRPPAPY